MNQQDDSNFPVVSIIIPCRNEEKFIGKCFESIIANDYLKVQEVSVVDGWISEERKLDLNCLKEKL